jgi:hypothetical protein
MFCTVCSLQDYWDNAWYEVRGTRTKALQSPFATDLFLFLGSTGSKQTLNGLFYVKPPTPKGGLRMFRSELFFLSNCAEKLRDEKSIL